MPFRAQVAETKSETWQDLLGAYNNVAAALSAGFRYAEQECVHDRVWIRVLDGSDREILKEKWIRPAERRD